MNPQAAQHTHSSSLVAFTYPSFIGSVLIVGAGVALMPHDNWIKGYLAMGIVMIIQSCITMTKTIRDVHESGKLVNRIEDAKAERLLMGIDSGSRRLAYSWDRAMRLRRLRWLQVGRSGWHRRRPGSPSRSDPRTARRSR